MIYVRHNRVLFSCFRLSASYNRFNQQDILGSCYFYVFIFATAKQPSCLSTHRRAVVGYQRFCRRLCQRGIDKISLKHLRCLYREQIFPWKRFETILPLASLIILYRNGESTALHLKQALLFPQILPLTSGRRHESLLNRASCLLYPGRTESRRVLPPSTTCVAFSMPYSAHKRKYRISLSHADNNRLLTPSFAALLA